MEVLGVDHDGGRVRLIGGGAAILRVVVRLAQELIEAHERTEQDQGEVQRLEFVGAVRRRVEAVQIGTAVVRRGFNVPIVAGKLEREIVSVRIITLIGRGRRKVVTRIDPTLIVTPAIELVSRGAEIAY